MVAGEGFGEVLDIEMRNAAGARDGADVDEDFEFFERVVPVVADLSAEGEVVGVSEDPIVRRGFTNVEAVGDFEAWAGDVVAAIPEDDGGEAEEEAEGGEDVDEETTHDE